MTSEAHASASEGRPDNTCRARTAWLLGVGHAENMNGRGNIAALFAVSGRAGAAIQDCSR